MTDEIKIIIPGTPRGKGRPRFSKKGKFVRVYTDDKTADYETVVKQAGRTAMNGREPHRIAVGAVINIELMPPASWSKKKRALAIAGHVLPTSKPDLDNYAKLIMDALNEIAYEDDSQVVSMYVRKWYAEAPRAVIYIRPVVHRAEF